ncbi:hypothetical protein MPSEU_000969100 [Mayamaea pseudoterrestris]|nr:hypothetical protein MPSEU_000969100 [Mayamaea pseudoterrestris]
MPETVLFEKTFKAISRDSAGPVNTLISVTISTNGTIVYWDHWEDGYENPSAASMQPTTEVWGDGNAANGCAPRKGVSCTNANDKLFAGQAIVIQNDVYTPRAATGAPRVYDGGDNVKATYPVAMTRGAYPDAPGSLLAGAVEVYDTSYGWGTDFFSPVGINADIATGAFGYVAMYCQAKEDNTIVEFNGGSTKTLKKGETILFENVRVADRVTSSKSIQVDVITGDPGSTYEMRWYALLPRNMYSKSYVGPVGNTKGGVGYVIFNPNPFSVTADYKWSVSGTTRSASLSIPARSNRMTQSIPSGTGVFIDSDDGDILAFSVIDIDETGQLFDWGFPVQPRDALTPQVLIGLGFGCTNNACDYRGVRSVVWVTSVADADLYIDYDNDGTVDEKRSIKALTSNLVYNSKTRDMSGAFIFATTPNSGPLGTPINLAAAWGQNPDFSFSGDDYALDLGTLVVPFPSIKVSKHIELTGDANGDGEYTAGDTVTYTIRIVNQSPREIAAGAFTILDPVLSQMSYITGSTRYSCGLGAVSSTVPDGTTGTKFPLDEVGLLSRCLLSSKGGEHAVSFQAKILDTAVNELKNAGILKSNVCGDLPFEVTVPLVVPPTESPTKSPTLAPSLPPISVGAKGCYATFTTGSMISCFPSKAGQHYNAGQVCTELLNGDNGDSVKITYDTTGSNYCLTEVQAYFGDTIPANKAGNPMIGNFPAKSTMNGSCIKTYTLQTPLVPGCAAGAEFMNRVYKFAAHSHVQFADGSGGQTAWTDGKDITTGGSWAMYSEAALNCKCVAPTKAPTRSPTKLPTGKPTGKPTKKPTSKPTGKPSKAPTGKPTKKPTGKPSKAPTGKPTKKPTGKPTKKPTGKPTKKPTGKPTGKPSKAPTGKPTKKPTGKPSKAPTQVPTLPPKITFAPPYEGNCPVPSNRKVLELSSSKRQVDHSNRRHRER